MGVRIFSTQGKHLSKTMEREFLFGQRTHESSTHVDHNVLLARGILGFENTRGSGEFHGKCLQNIRENSDTNIHDIHKDICLHGSDQRNSISNLNDMGR